MQFKVKTNKKPCTIALLFEAPVKTKIFLRVSDADERKPFTNFTNRYCEVEGRKVLYVRMPIAPEKAEIFVHSDKELSNGRDRSYKLIDGKVLPLKRSLSAFNHASPTVRNFVNFAQQFSETAGYISAKGSIYTSDDGQFRIDYLDDITDEQGRSQKTPARIHRNQAVIEVSRDKFREYTVPMRMCILLHEFSHFYMNTKMSNETEADLNGLLIYLGLGYPRIDAYNVFTQVFATTDNNVNRNRMRIIDQFIRNFERKHIQMQYSDDNLYKNYHNG